MAIIVDKIKKRQDIALACKDILIKQCINNVSIASLTKAAGISKGSFYDYFTNKEDLLFEVINIYLSFHNEIKQNKLNSVNSAREKVKVFLQVFYEEDDDNLKELYREFLSITLSNPSKEMMEYHLKRNDEYYKWFESIFENGIKKGELKPISREVVNGLYILGHGVFMSRLTCNSIQSNQTEADKFIDAIFNFIEV
ncbi:TetR/AcrR family transcriptional regulator [Halarcobacter ebronensis]|uniref:TetR family transcriptional regulator n=1 Tax=Halarcobacter ebronensis TaxID=1462615 RepID=A0A4Q1ASG6_9BACT|nr:TetR/AcrR family transcriptional regulator [Halarcobacter ebronensis]QKF80844.1 transcriptional regulator, TetR/AcrR family [Halarcobacter ebronensis]RXK08634.1 TetR family transcriptional regulator [Halarcobacter ebronensis]